MKNHLPDFIEQYHQPADGVYRLDRGAILGNLALLAPHYAALNTEAFALREATSVYEARERLAATDLLFFAHMDTELIGFATYQRIPSAMGTVMYQARGLLRQARGRGWGRKFPQLAASELHADFLMAKAQNPVSIWSTMASRILTKVYPIEDAFSVSTEMSRVLLDTVSARGKCGEVDLATGVHEQSYPMGKLGDYTPDTDHPGVSMVQTRLAALGVDALRGDAVYYGGKIVHQEGDV